MSPKKHSTQNKYFEYLLYKRTRLSYIYRKYWLYPKINNNFTGSKILDVGCGIGDFLKFRPETLGIDINPKLIEHCKKNNLNVKLIKNNIFPFSDSSFEGVLLDNVLEHIEKPNDLIFEIKRVLKLNGIFIIGVPGIKGYSYDKDHKIYYDENKLISYISNFGFKLKTVNHMPFRSNLMNKYLRQYCLYGIFILGN